MGPDDYPDPSQLSDDDLYRNYGHIHDSFGDDDSYADVESEYRGEIVDRGNDKYQEWLDNED